MAAIALVAVENAAIDFDKEYSYLIPEDMAKTALAGCRCTVPFGGGNKKRTGIILNVTGAEDTSRLKSVFALLDQKPVLGEEGLILLRYIRETTFCTWFDALRLLIPAGIGVKYQVVYSPCDENVAVPMLPLANELFAYIASRRAPVSHDALLKKFSLADDDRSLAALVECGAILKSETPRRRVLDEKQIMVRLTAGSSGLKYTPKQKQAVEFLSQNETASLKEACYYAGVTRSVMDTLLKKGAVEYYDNISLRNPYSNAEAADAEGSALSDAQEAVYTAILRHYNTENRIPAMLYGVTGSGKTEIYLKLIEHVISIGKTAIVLVPEISLTAQAVSGFHRRFGSRVAVLHSGLSAGERMDEWRRIENGGADIVVGTRSAVFAPVKQLGLIVIDEEQEHTYKSDKSPRYHARDVALKRCGYNNALLMLSSATPSIESFHAAETGKYKLYVLDKRFNKSLLPDVEVIDMRDAANQSAYPSLSSVLLEQLHDNLARGEQSLLLLNRRGHSTLVRCSSCGAVAECPNCSVALTYHNANDSLLCHYCGYTRLAAVDSSVCSTCGSKLVRYSGLGTQKLEEELKNLFPDAGILRVDMDTTMSKLSHEKLFGAFAAREYDIMLGTQMVAKGLNFPDVTLVGILQADQSLYSGDYRSFERTFSLLTQVIGRGGRGDKRGRACIQTYAPDNPVIMLAAKQCYPVFFEQEIKLRKLHLYPPFCTMCAVGFSGENHDEVRTASEIFTERFKDTAEHNFSDLPVRLLGPSPSEVLRTANKYRYKLIVKCRNDARTRQMLRELLTWFYSENKNVGAFIDMHY